jgi:hypothetical protein
MSLKGQIEGIQIFFKQYKQRSKEKNMERRKRISDISSQMFGRKNVKSFSILNPISFSLVVHFE